jgi:lipopolysaccharide transport system ATP-binding protein
MSEISIRCEGLSKQYQIGERLRYKALRDTLTNAMYAPFRRLRDGSHRSNVQRFIGSNDSFWALKDVSLEVKQGEVVGIIGRNGAGKSTLLKVLSRITEPTGGRAEIDGRVGSLLEVGTGFNPELTGRENIYLNGAILGMKKAEIQRKFNEIVEFADVHKFTDTPVKHYSTGMHLRLAFGVAAHLEPEIMLVDEVLAVGDAEFQKKCLQKMREVGSRGRTILFVSHNMSAVRNICSKGVLLDQGRVVDSGDIDAVADRYLARMGQSQTNGRAVETDSFIGHEVQIRSQRGEVIKPFDTVEIWVHFTPKIDIADPGLYLGLLSLDGLRVTGLDFKDFRSVAPMRAGERRRLGFSIDQFPLLPGTYQLDVHLKDMAHHKVEFVPFQCQFDVAESPVYGGRKIDGWYGKVALRARALA